MSDTRILSPNGDQVAAKIMDGEAVLINLTTGMYYSMADTATDVWSCIEQGCSVDTIACRLAEKYGVSKDVAREDVKSLVTELETEGLVSTSEVVGADAAPSDSAPGASGHSYSAPKLEKFSDMAEMFALDPPLPGLADSRQN